MSKASPSRKQPGLSRTLSNYVRPSSSFDAASSSYLADDQFSGLTLLDLFVVLEAHFDLISRKIVDTSNQWRAKAEDIKHRAEEVLAKRTISLKDMTAFGESSTIDAPRNTKRKRTAPAEILERELRNVKERLMVRMEKLQSRWQDSRVVSSREKIAFVIGVMNVLVSALLIGFKPEWVQRTWSYTIQLVCLLPIRVYTYRQKNYHYFLLDSCYLINILTLCYIWVLPGSVLLLEALFALTFGPLASAVATWRNSLVFHSLDKVTSLFIHMYPAFVFHTIIHHYPDNTRRFPALKRMPKLNIVETILISSTVYLIWQIAYYYFVIVARKEKIEHGGRLNVSSLLNDKKGMIGKILAGIRPERREPYFMACQYLYTIVTMMPALLFFFSSQFWSSTYLILIFTVSVWNGSVFYLEVWTRRFEREIVKLRQELEQMQAEVAAARALSTQTSSGATSPAFGPVQDSPAFSPETQASFRDPREAIPALSLDDAVTEEDRMSNESGILVDISDGDAKDKTD